jgi:hypothetical protein
VIYLNPILIFHWLVISASCATFVLVANKATISALVFDAYIVMLIVYVTFKARGVGKYFPSSFLIIFSIFVWQAYLYSNGSVFDTEWYAFLRSTRFLFYLLIFIYIGEVTSTKEWRGTSLNYADFKKFITQLIILFAIVYLFQIMALGESRPKLYSENNYEIPSVLLLILIFLYSGKGVEDSKYFPLFGGGLSILSMSKSGILEAAYVILMGKNKEVSIKSTVVLGFSGLLVGVIVAIVLISRMEGIELESLDRVKFLMVFWDLMVDSDLWEAGFGHGAASKLSFSSCMELKYWASAISEDYAFCDATVFHSLFLKLTYDFGLIGLITFIYSWLYFLQRYFGKSLGFKLFVVVFVCSLSVSGFSNSIVIWPVFFVLVFFNVSPKEA